MTEKTKKKSLKFAMFAIFLVGLILLQSCSGAEDNEENEAECSVNSDCISFGCEIGVCNEGECVTKLKDNCCGNNACEVNETKCSCSKDCGACNGEDGSLFEVCRDDECIWEIDESKSSEKQSFMDIDLEENVKIKLIQEYETPLMINNALMKFTFISESLGDARNIKIDKFTIDGQIGSNPAYLGRYDRDFSFYSEDLSYDAYFIPKIVKDKENSEIKSLKINVWYSIESEDDIITKEKAFNLPISTIEYSDIDFEFKCPDSCDDSNELTEDICSEETLFNCVYELKEDECGNLICEDSENSCSCPTDCAPCETKYSDENIEGKCESNKCVAKYSGVFEGKNLLEDVSLSGVDLQIKYSFETPITNLTSFDIDMEIKDMPDSINSIEITEIDIISGSELFAQTIFEDGNNLNSIGDSETFNVWFKEEDIKNEEKALSAKIYYTIDDGEEKRATYSKNLGSVRIINTELYE